MNEEEIKEYINRKDNLLLKLSDKDKETLEWILFGYNECARLLHEKEQENQQLKAQYCERTDCSGRIGNSKKVEELETEKKQLNNLVNSCQKEIRRLKKELQALKTSDDEWLKKSDK